MVLVESSGSCEGRERIHPARRDAPPRGPGQGGRHVALRWRIRHKLLVGLGVVVGIIALLTIGTLYGLAAFSGTVKTGGSKIAELHYAEQLKQQISYLRSSTSEPNKTLDG